MFGKKKRLLRDGTQARAVVVDAERHGGQIVSEGAVPVSYRLRLRVHLDSGTTFDAVCTVGGQLHSARTYYSPGDIVPVRFDPEHPDTVLVDESALLAEREDQRRAAAEAVVERAERRLAGLPELGRDLPTDEAMYAAHERWKTAASRAKEARTAHRHAQAGEDKRETLRLFNASVKRAAEEKTARERYHDLRKLRPDWMPDGG